MTGIRHLAKSLNMSVSTVSRALNDSPEASTATKALVREAAGRLGYVPNQSGRSLRKGATGTIGFMLQTGTDVTGLGDGFFMSVFDGVQTVLVRHDLDLLALLCAAGQDRDAYLRRMVAKGVVDGMIITHIDRIDPRIDVLAAAGMPFVTMGRSLNDAGQPWLDPDLDSHSAISVARLVAKGHRRIAITVPDDEINIGYVRLEAMTQALAAHGLTLSPDWILRVPPTELGGMAAAEQLVTLQSERPTAIVLSNEYHTTGFYRGLEQHGLRPGQDMAIIGFASAHSRYLSPKLTAFRQDPRSIGLQLGEALLGRMPAYQKHYPGGVVRKLWPLELVPGESDAMSVGPAATSLPHS